MSVSQSQQVPTNDLITANGLTYDPASFPASGTLCIREKCSVCVVKQNDTCKDITDSNSLSMAQFMAWNPTINGLCTNLVDMVNQTICLSNPLGDYLVANNTGTDTFNTPVPIPTSTVPNTTLNCGEYYLVQTGDDCSTISLKFNIALTDFLFLNPEVFANCTNLWLNYSYCVAPVGSISTYPGYGGATSTFSITSETSTPLPWVDPFESNRTDFVIIPIANNTRIDCWDYIWLNGSLISPMSC